MVRCATATTTRCFQLLLLLLVMLETALLLLLVLLLSLMVVLQVLHASHGAMILANCCIPSVLIPGAIPCRRGVTG